MERPLSKKNRIGVPGGFDNNSQIEASSGKRTKVDGSFDYIGEINQKIGTGNNAKDAIAYLCLKWSFIILSVILALISFYSAVMIYKNQEESYIDNLLKGCGIITPIITLLLGFIFGNKMKH